MCYKLIYTHLTKKKEKHCQNSRRANNTNNKH